MLKPLLISGHPLLASEPPLLGWSGHAAFTAGLGAPRIGLGAIPTGLGAIFLAPAFSKVSSMVLPHLQKCVYDLREISIQPSKAIATLMYACSHLSSLPVAQGTDGVVQVFQPPRLAREQPLAEVTGLGRRHAITLDRD